MADQLAVDGHVVVVAATTTTTTTHWLVVILITNSIIVVVVVVVEGLVLAPTMTPPTLASADDGRASVL